MIYVLAANRLHAQHAIYKHAELWNKSPAEYRYISSPKQLFGIKLGKGEYFLKYETWVDHPEFEEMYDRVKMLETLYKHEVAMRNAPWYRKAWNWLRRR